MADGTDWSSIQNQFNLQPQDIANLQNQGFTPSSASGFLTGVVGSGTQPRSNLAGPGGGSDPAGANQVQPSQLTPSQAVQFAGVANALGMGGGQQQGMGMQMGPVNPNQPTVNLGAAALNQNAIYNPTPQQASAKSGVGQVAMPTMSNTVPTAPQGPWSNSPTGSVFARNVQLAPTQNPRGWAAPTPYAGGMGYMPGAGFATPPPAPGAVVSPTAPPMGTPYPTPSRQPNVPVNFAGALGQLPPAAPTTGAPTMGGGARVALATPTITTWDQVGTKPTYYRPKG